MDPTSVTMAELFVPDLDGEPAAWVDILFLVSISLLHLVFTCKLTTFSLSYLNAKCEERKSGETWSTSRLYARAVHPPLHGDAPLPITNYVNTSWWSRCVVARYAVRVLLFLSSWVPLFYAVILWLDLAFEYVVASASRPEYGSYLALLLLPSFVFVAVTVLRFLCYGAMATWTLNVDAIAHRLDLEFKRHQLHLQRLNGELDPKSPDDVDVDDLDKDDDLTLLQSLSAPFWMAFWWRFLTISSCIVFTLLALPTVIRSDVSYRFAHFL